MAPLPQAHTAFAPSQVSPPVPAPAGYPAPAGWDQAGLIAALNQMALQGTNPWVLDTGATSHMSSNDGILFSRLPHLPSFITVGNGSSIPICSRGTSTLSLADHTFKLNNVLVAPQLVRNLLSVRQFTRDNNCSIEFDALGFSVKDPKTRTVILRCNSDGDLYTIPSTPPPASCHLADASALLWHSRLGHPAPAAIASLNKLSAISCKHTIRGLCHACQLGKHFRLPFTSSSSSTSAPFELVHCDVWTSPVLSISGFKYYLVIG